MCVCVCVCGAGGGEGEGDPKFHVTEKQEEQMLIWSAYISSSAVSIIIPSLKERFKSIWM